MIADNHNHVVEHGDAVAMARAGAERGLDEIGFAEHVGHIAEARAAIHGLDRFPDEGPPLSHAAYVEALRRAGEAASVPVRVGLELEAVPDDRDLCAGQDELTARFGAAWDLVVGSVHVVGDGVLLEDGASVPDVERLWRDYEERLLASVASGRYDVIGHPTRLAVVGGRLPADPARSFDELARLAARHDVAVEANAVDCRIVPSLVAELMRACARHGAAVSLGSDAHAPERMGEIASHVALLRDAGVRQTVAFEGRRPREIPLPDGDRAAAAS